MRRILFVIFPLIVWCTPAASAQEQPEQSTFIFKPFSVSAGMELNQNARRGMVPEFLAALDYEIDPIMTFGFRFGMTYWSPEPEDSLISVMEGIIFGRFYLYKFNWPLGQIRPYIQAGAGAASSRELEYEVQDFLGEGVLGCRAHLSGWFADVSLRYGYPFQFGVNLMLGHSFLP